MLGKIEKHLLLSVFLCFEAVNFFYSFTWCNDEHDKGSISVGLRGPYWNILSIKKKHTHIYSAEWRTVLFSGGYYSIFAPGMQTRQ